MPAPTLVLPCSRCHSRAAVQLTPPLISREVRKWIDPILKILSAKTGDKITLPADGASWLDLFADRDALSEVLELQCSHCLAIEADLPQRVFDANT